jgi:RimJ/RimL family protein N-acetyltransferase
MQLRDGDLELRPWTLDDVPALVAACNDDEIRRWLTMIPSPYTEDDARTYIEGKVPNAGRNQFAITENGSVVGAIGLDVTESIRQGTIGYWCAREARGRGVTTRALRLLSRHAFDALGLERLQLFTDPDNHASQRVAEKVGYQREGVVRSHLPQRDGTRRDSIAFSLLPGELA